jgi:hypothetical protein
MNSIILISDGKPEKVGNNLWQLTEDYVMVVNGKEYRVPKGYLTDLASIPYPFSLAFPKDPSKGYSKAAILHDSYYTKHNKKSYWLVQVQFYKNLRALGVNHPTAFAMFMAVLLVSWVWWKP